MQQWKFQMWEWMTRPDQASSVVEILVGEIDEQQKLDTCLLFLSLFLSRTSYLSFFFSFFPTIFNIEVVWRNGQYNKIETR